MSDSYDPYSLAYLQYLQDQALGQVPSGFVEDPKNTVPAIDLYNKQNTGLFHDMQNIFSPELALLAASNGLGGALDYSSFVGQDPIETVPQPFISTPTLDSLSNGKYRVVADAVRQGADVATINSSIRALDLDDDEKKDLMQAAGQAQKEMQDSARAQYDYQQKVAATKPTQTPMQKVAAQSGLPDPLAQYTPDDVEDPDPQGWERIAADTKSKELLRQAAELSHKASRFDQVADADRKLMTGTLGQVPYGSGAPYANQAPTPQSQSGPPNLGERLGGAAQAVGGGAQSIWNTYDSGMQDLGHNIANFVTGNEDVKAELSPDFAANQQRQRDAIARSGKAPLGQNKPKVASADEAKKLRGQAQSTQRLADYYVKDAERSHNARRAFAAARMNATGRTPFSDAIALRKAQLDILRGQV